jgi:branched-chain amino acid transport system substrate-binding protein
VGHRATKVIGATALLLLAGCDLGGSSIEPTPENTTTTAAPVPVASDGVYRIGVLVPTEGEGAALGQALQAGVDVAVQTITNAGGVAGLSIETIPRSEPSDPAQAAELVEAMISESRIDALVGPASSSNALAVLEQVTSAGVLTCSPTATAIELSDFPDDGYFVRTIGSDALMASAMAQAIDGSGATRAAVLFPNDDYGVDVADALRGELSARDISDVSPVAYGLETAVDDVVEQALDNAPQAVGVIGSIPTGADVLAALHARRGGLRALPTVVSDGLRSPALADLVAPGDPASIDGIDGVSPVASPASWLLPDLTTRDAGAPTAYAGHAYDCVNLLALAAESAGTDDPAAAVNEVIDVSRGGTSCLTFATCVNVLRDGLNIDLDGASGQLELDDEGDVTLAAYEQFTYVGGVDTRSEMISIRA